MAAKSITKSTSLWGYITLSLRMVWLGITSAMEYRVSFVTQVAGIIFNNATYLMIWVLFFNRFQIINGWQISDIMLMFSVFFLTFGLLGIFGGGLYELAKYIARGELDYFLTFPKNVLWHAAVNRTEIPGIGDLLLGLGVFCLLTGPLYLEKVVVFSLVSFIATLILFNFIIVTQSLTFFLGNFEETADRWLWTMFGVAVYPQTIFSGWLKVVIMTVLPTFFLVYLPVSLLKHFMWLPLGLMVLFWLVTTWLAYFVFHRGLRRYESGNLINLRV